MENHLQNAKNLLTSSETSAMRYACLELRMAIEKYVYNKLEFHSKRYGTKLLYQNWRPNKAIKILCQLEPRANQSYTMAIAEQTGQPVESLDYQMIGCHHALSTKWINKNYNTLGSYLHMQPESKEVSQPRIEFLTDIIDELAKTETGILQSSFAPTVIFNCAYCNGHIEYCEEALPNVDEVVCPNRDCPATYTASSQDGEWFVKPNDLVFDCPSCKNKSIVFEKHLQFGQTIKCGSCDIIFRVVGRDIKLARVLNNLPI